MLNRVKDKGKELYNSDYAVPVFVLMVLAITILACTVIVLVNHAQCNPTDSIGFRLGWWMVRYGLA